MSEHPIPHDYMPTLDQAMRFMRSNPRTSVDILTQMLAEGLIPITEMDRLYGATFKALGAARSKATATVRSASGELNGK